MTLSDKDLKAFEDRVRPGAVYRLSETLPERQRINRVRREATQTLSKSLNLETDQAESLVRFVVQRIVDHFEGGAT